MYRYKYICFNYNNTVVLHFYAIVIYGAKWLKLPGFLYTSRVLKDLNRIIVSPQPVHSGSFSVSGCHKMWDYYCAQWTRAEMMTLTDALGN